MRSRSSSFLSSQSVRAGGRKSTGRSTTSINGGQSASDRCFAASFLAPCCPRTHDLAKEFYQTQHFASVTVFDPFMGSGTTIGEAHKLGLTAIGRDINPVAVEAVRTALGPMDRRQPEARCSGTYRKAWENESEPFTDRRTRRVCLATYSISSGSCRRPASNATPLSIFSRPGSSHGTLTPAGSRKSRSFAPRAETSFRAFMARRR